MTFNDFVGHEDAKLALILNAIDHHCGGVLLFGEKGCGKSTLSRLFKNLLPGETLFVNLPLNATEDALLGGIDVEESLKKGSKVFQCGILRRAQGGVLYIDDVNLLSPEIMALVLRGQGGREIPQAREGAELNIMSDFILLASMNPEEGYLSSHLLDRFGMCVVWESLKDTVQKIEVMKRAMLYRRDKDTGSDKKLREKIYASRLALKNIIVPAEIKDYITQACLENRISGHRGDIFLFYASRAYAAFCNEQEVTKEHVDVVLPLVLIHRKRLLQQMQEEKTENHHNHEKPPEQKEAQENNQQPSPEPVENNKDAHHDDGIASPGDLNERTRETSQAEEILAPGQAFKVKRLTFRKDRMNRYISGRRTKTGSKGKSGRYIKSILKANDDIAIDATIRAASPYQIARGRKERLLIRDSDIRFKQREKKMGHLVILVVDGSGSMGAQRRMVETKGTVQSLLIDCYQKRDMVSMIVFRKDRAEVVLPPTSSVETASRRLREIPVGGKTPLTAGLVETYRLIKRVTVKSPETRFLVVLVTDGRANQSISGAPVGEEIEKITQTLSESRFTDYIVIDTEDKGKFIKTDLALHIASKLGADYYTIDDLKADYLTEIVQLKKTELS
ncbi:MAG TPA: AAA family ATPase [Syntrophales bacterium]|nr:AAA family ATPase [Syntrophales bacterium]